MKWSDVLRFIDGEAEIVPRVSERRLISYLAHTAKNKSSVNWHRAREMYLELCRMPSCRPLGIPFNEHIFEWADMIKASRQNKKEIYFRHQTDYKLLKRLFYIFIHSKDFEEVQLRFGWEVPALWHRYPRSILHSWFQLWAFLQYPRCFFYLFGRAMGWHHRLSGIPFAQLVRYLPKFMLWRIYGLGEYYSPLYVHLGSGGSIRQFDGLLVAFSKKEAHYFTNAPHYFEFTLAVWYAKVKARGRKIAISLCSKQILWV